MFKAAMHMLADAGAEAHRLNWEQLRRELLLSQEMPASCKMVLKKVDTVESFRRCCLQELLILTSHSGSK